MLSILFITLYLTSTSAFLDVLKFPILVEHYLDHKKSNASISFSDFLGLHYSGETLSHTHSTQKNPHDGLPFHQQTTTVNPVIAQPILLDYTLNQPYTQDTEKSIRIDTAFFTDTTYISSIWQPPRFC